MNNPSTSVAASGLGHCLMHLSDYGLPDGYAIVVTVRRDEWEIEMLDPDGDVIATSDEFDQQGCVGSSPSRVIDQMVEREIHEAGIEVE